jgi:hypothetical protein
MGGLQMNDIILIFIDQKKRDAFGMMMIYNYLKKRDINVVLSSDIDFFVKYLYYRPKVVLQGNPDVRHGYYGRFISNYSIIYALPTEQTITDLDFAVKRITEGHSPTSKLLPPYVEGIYKFFIWGKKITERLKDECEFDNKIIHTGCIKNYNLNKSHVKNTKVIGIALEDEFNYKNISQMLFVNNNNNYTFYCKEIKNFYTFGIHVANKINEIITKLDENNYKIVVRPRLSTSDSDFSYLTNNFKNIEIDHGESSYDFFKKIDFLILAQSSIGTEAQMEGIPVISINGLLSDVIEFCRIDTSNDKIQHYWQVSNFNNIFTLLDNNSLEVSPKMDSFNNYVDSFFASSDVNKHSSEYIAIELEHGLKNFTKIKKEFKPSYPINYIFIKNLLSARFRFPIIYKSIYNGFEKNTFLNKCVVLTIFTLVKIKNNIKFTFDKSSKDSSLFFDIDKKLFKKNYKIFQDLDNKMSKSVSKNN